MKDRTEEGYIAAQRAVARGENPRALRDQASSDLEPDTFTSGWKAACDAALAQSGGQET